MLSKKDGIVHPGHTGRCTDRCYNKLRILVVLLKCPEQTDVEVSKETDYESVRASQLNRGEARISKYLSQVDLLLLGLIATIGVGGLCTGVERLTPEKCKYLTTVHAHGQKMHLGMDYVRFGRDVRWCSISGKECLPGRWVCYARIQIVEYTTGEDGWLLEGYVSDA